RAEELLLDGVAKAVRLAHADGRPFLLWAGAGIDARVMANMRLGWKRLLGRAGIFPTALKEFLRYQFPPLRGTIDGAAPEAAFPRAAPRPRAPPPPATTAADGSSLPARASTPTTSTS